MLKLWPKDILNITILWIIEKESGRHICHTPTKACGDRRLEKIKKSYMNLIMKDIMMPSAIIKD